MSDQISFAEDMYNCIGEEYLGWPAIQYTYLENVIDVDEYKHILYALDKILNIRFNSISHTAFFNGIKHSVLYAEHHDGNINAPKAFEINNYKVGNFQSNQRQKYRKGMLLQEQIEILNKLKFNWTPQHGGHNKA